MNEILRNQFNSFYELLKDYNELSNLEFYEKHIDTTWYKELNKDWDKCDKEQYDNDYESFKQEWIWDNLDEDYVFQRIEEFFIPVSLDKYTNTELQEIYIIEESTWWPNVHIYIDNTNYFGIYKSNIWSDQLVRLIETELIESYAEVLWL